MGGVAGMTCCEVGALGFRMAAALRDQGATSPEMTMNE